jgi:hypothetical protein
LQSTIGTVERLFAGLRLSFVLGAALDGSLEHGKGCIRVHLAEGGASQSRRVSPLNDDARDRFLRGNAGDLGAAERPVLKLP